MKFKHYNPFSKLISNDHSFSKLTSLELPCFKDTRNSIIGKFFKSNNNTITVHHICNEDIIISNLINDYNMTYDESVEYYDFNILSAYIGTNTPVFVSLSQMH